MFFHGAIVWWFRNAAELPCSAGSVPSSNFCSECGLRWENAGISGSFRGCGDLWGDFLRVFGSGHCVAAEISRFELTSVGAPGWSRCCRGPTAGLCDVRSLRQCHSRVMAVPTCVCSVLASVERPGVFCGWAGRSDGEDKSRSLGFSPGTNFSSSLKFPVFLSDGAGQE